MLRLPLAGIVAAALAGTSLTAAAQSPAPKHKTSVKPIKGTHRPTFGNTIRIGGSSGGRRVSAAACNQRAAAMPGAAGTGTSLGPNGASASQTIVAVPVGGGNAAAVTRQHEIAEACAHIRR